nr:hypothetical protein CFP56_41483 [Quercus suber]
MSTPVDHSSTRLGRQQQHPLNDSSMISTFVAQFDHPACGRFRGRGWAVNKKGEKNPFGFSVADQNVAPMSRRKTCNWAIGKRPWDVLAGPSTSLSVVSASPIPQKLRREKQMGRPSL